MMEITANAIQTVNINQNVLFTDTVVCGNCSMAHRDGSGLVTIRGMTNQCRARYKITFGGNIAVPNGQTIGPISLAISLDGEAIATTTMTAVPAAADNYWNVFSAIIVDVPKGCCSTIGVQNISTIPVNVQNANLIVDRIA